MGALRPPGSRGASSTPLVLVLVLVLDEALGLMKVNQTASATQQQRSTMLARIHLVSIAAAGVAEEEEAEFMPP